MTTATCKQAKTNGNMTRLSCKQEREWQKDTIKWTYCPHCGKKIERVEK